MRVMVTRHAWQEWNRDQRRQWSRAEIAKAVRPRLDRLLVERRRDKWQVKVWADGGWMNAVVTPELDGWTVVTAWRVS